MKRETYKSSLCISAVIWFVFTILAWWIKYDLGTVATLGGIALMFTWMWESENITD